jgi:hypothetical protein
VILVGELGGGEGLDVDDGAHAEQEGGKVRVPVGLTLIEAVGDVGLAENGNGRSDGMEELADEPGLLLRGDL